MALSPNIARLLPERLRVFTEGLRYPLVFLISIPAFVAALLFSPYIPHAEQVLAALGLTLFVSSRLR